MLSVEDWVKFELGVICNDVLCIKWSLWKW